MKYEPKFVKLEGSKPIELPEGAIVIHYENDGYGGLPEKLCAFGILIYLSPQSSNQKANKGVKE